MYVDTLQEHLDHEAGAYRSEHEAAFALSRREFDNGMGAINALTAAGRFVVAIYGPAHCRFTDAILGKRYFLQSDHATREEAQAAAAKIDADMEGDWDEGGIEVLPRLPLPERAAPVSWDDDDLPF